MPGTHAGSSCDAPHAAFAARPTAPARSNQRGISTQPNRGKSEHERIAALEDLFGQLRSDLDTLARHTEAAGRSALPALWPDLGGVLAAAISAIVPLPRTISQGAGKSPCANAGSTTDVHTVAANANLAFVVENVGACGTVHIQLTRAAAVVAQSPLANKGNTASLGPVAAQRGDIAQVVCGGGGPGGAQKCEFNWQVNAAGP